MTREEAIERLKQNKAAAKFYAGMSQNTNAIENELKDIEALDMAIEALSNEDQHVQHVDLLSRQAVIELVKNSYYNLAENMDDVWAMVADVEQIPSADEQDDNRLYIRIYANDEPSRKAEKLYQICGETESQEVAQWLKEYFPSVDRSTEWIPCSERMPDAEYGEGDSVLCCTELGLMYILYWNGGNWCVPTGEPHILVNHKTGWHDRVIAWMPLPTPYKGGNSE